MRQAEIYLSQVSWEFVICQKPHWEGWNTHKYTRRYFSTDIHTWICTNTPGRGLCTAAGAGSCAPTPLITHLFPHAGLLLHRCSRPCAKYGAHPFYFGCYKLTVVGMLTSLCAFHVNQIMYLLLLRACFVLPAKPAPSHFQACFRHCAVTSLTSNPFLWLSSRAEHRQSGSAASLLTFPFMVLFHVKRWHMDA